MRKTLQAAGSLIALTIAGCTHLHPSPDEISQHRPEMPATFSSPAESPQLPLPGCWWEQFESPELNTLVTSAFTGNLNLGQAWARLKQAEAKATIAGASRKLSVDASGAGGSTRTRRDIGGSPDRESSNSIELGLRASYELDIWGKLKAGTEAAILESQATGYDADATALLLSGQVAETWIRILAQTEQIALLEGQVKTTRSVLDLLEERQRKGLSAAVDIFQQKQIVAETESLLPLARQELHLLKQKLAVLTGSPPEATPSILTKHMPELPPLPATGLPAALLEKRPDIQADWNRLHAIHWNLSAAKADRLPAIRLTASTTTNSENFHRLFDYWALNLLANLTAPIIDGGRRRAEVERVRAILEQQILAYKQTVLDALQEVENGLTRDHYQTRYQVKIHEQLSHANATLEEARRRYQKGATDYLPVLSALNAALRLERSIVTIRRDLLTNRITLYLALGGGTGTGL